MSNRMTWLHGFAIGLTFWVWTLAACLLAAEFGWI